MDYTNLGTSGLKVSRIALGCMSFGTPREVMSWTLDEDAAQPIFRQALDLGITFWDTANVYGAGSSEEIVGRAIKQLTTREQIVLATKVFWPMHAGPGGSGLSRKAILEQVDASLRRLGTDYVDLLQIHRFDPDVPVEETMEALHDVVKAGKARYLGASSMWAWRFAKMQHAAERHGWTTFISMQDQYSLLAREEEREMFGLLADQGVGSIPWSPLAGGRLTRPWGQTGSPRSESNPSIDMFGRPLWLESDQTIVDAVQRIAQTHGVSMATVAMAWVLKHPVVDAPIVGAPKPHHLADAVAALDLQLADEEIGALEKRYTPRLPTYFNERINTMNYRPLGRTGVHVSPLCLGTMMFGAWGNTDHDDSVRIIHRALDEGINFIDTADVYSAGESEEIVGKALKGRRDDVVLATKFFMPMGEDPNQRGGSRRWIVREVENSLRRLSTDYIDLYQVHRPSPDTDVEETLGALTDLVRQGKVRYIGSSSYSGAEIVEAQWTARDRGLERFRTEQPPYSILTRLIELDVLPTAQRHGMGILTYSPLAGGWLSGRYGKDANASPASSARARGALAARFDMSLPENERKLDAVEALAEVADDAGLSLIELAIAFVIRHPGVTAAIIGPRTMEQLQSQLPAANVVLDDTVLDRIDEIVKPGVNLNPADTSYGDHALQPTARRR